MLSTTGDTISDLISEDGSAVAREEYISAYGYRTDSVGPSNMPLKSLSRSTFLELLDFPTMECEVVQLSCHGRPGWRGAAHARATIAHRCLRALQFNNTTSGKTTDSARKQR